MANDMLTRPPRQTTEPMPVSRNGWVLVALAVIIILVIAVVVAAKPGRQSVNTKGSTTFAAAAGKPSNGPCKTQPILAVGSPNANTVKQLLGIEQQAVLHRNATCLYNVVVPPHSTSAGDYEGDSEGYSYIATTRFNPFGSGRFAAHITGSEQSYTVTVAGGTVCHVTVVAYQSHWYFDGTLPQFRKGQRQNCS